MRSADGPPYGISSQSDYRTADGSIPHGPPTLFSGQRGDPLSPRAVQRIIAKYAGLANLESVSPHTLRHSFGKNLVNAGVTLEKVAMLMGHESLDTTRIYIVPSANDLANAVERLAG